MKVLHLTVNGKTFSVPVTEHEMLSTVIREKIGLTGTKIGCSQGSCGACTVLVNEEPVVSCITPALRFDGAAITTIEGVSEDGKLHPLQEKFVSKGAIQCGFCTPGMVMTALAITKKYSADTILRPDSKDLKEEIKEGLSGNVCRCTGYKKIIEAVTEYAIENGNGITSHAPSELNGMVGTGRPAIEAEKKVKGIADYADDIRINNALHVKFLRSLHAHAKIINIDTLDAIRLPGVRYVATGVELPVKFGVLPISHDETAMAIDKVRYAGEIVAAVAADTEEIAAAACKLIRVRYQPIKEFLTIDEAIHDISDHEKIHEHKKFNNNIHKRAELKFGNQQEE
ncbi:MAG TPA: 2Fe-2S iron-sulfur cluster-binding protein, partial [Bacteroidia bacterium]|nr:2Fe-2S iron-sulfur cluster-binding protein [Bacteroidia bacterium]